MTNKIHIATILAAHGIRGQVKIRCFSDNPRDIFSYKNITDKSGKRTFKLTSGGGNDDALIAAIEGVADRNAAELLKKTELFVPESELPEKGEGSFYHRELIGLSAILENDEIYGKIIAVYNFGAGDIIEIEKAGKKTEMIPFNSNFVSKIDIRAGTIVITPPEYD